MVQLKAVFPHGACLVLAFEFMLSDLAEVLRHAQRPLVQAQVKSYLQMLLRGVAFCHAHNIVHRVSPSMGWSKYGQRGRGLWLGPGEGGAWAELGAQLDILFEPRPSGASRGTDASFGAHRT